MVRRRELLGVGAAGGIGLLAGCIGDPGARGTPFPDETVPWPEGPKERPERPESLTVASVRRFVRRHEYRYVYNQLWMGEGTEVDLDCEVNRIEPVGSGYRVIVTCTGSATAGGRPRTDGNGTTTPIHADYFAQAYVYFVDEDSLVRRQTSALEGNS